MSQEQEGSIQLCKNYKESHKYEDMHIFVRCHNTEANDNKNSFSWLALAGVKPQVAVELRKRDCEEVETACFTSEKCGHEEDWNNTLEKDQRETKAPEKFVGFWFSL